MSFYKFDEYKTRHSYERIRKGILRNFNLVTPMKARTMRFSTSDRKMIGVQ